MSTFPAISGAHLIRALRKLGFEVIRIKAVTTSFNILTDDARWCPCHRGETIGRGLLAQILRDCELSSDELREKL